MTKINLTENEIAVLTKFNTYEDLEATKSDLGVSWTDAGELANATDKPVKSIKGILGSLTKKGLIQSDSENTNLVCLTEEGADELYCIRSEAEVDQPEAVLDGAVQIVGEETLTEEPVADVATVELPEAPAEEAPAEAEAAKPVAPRALKQVINADGSVTIYAPKKVAFFPAGSEQFMQIDGFAREWFGDFPIRWNQTDDRRAKAAAKSGKLKIVLSTDASAEEQAQELADQLDKAGIESETLIEAFIALYAE